MRKLVSFLLFAFIGVNLVSAQVKLSYSGVNPDGSGTDNSSISKIIAADYTYAITVPEGAIAFVGKKSAHFKRFTEMTPESVITADGNTVYTYKLAGSQEYNYRISQPGKVTYAKVFTKTSADENLIITPEMLAGDPKTIDHNVNSNNGYNVADIFLNINEKGHLNLLRGATFQLVNLRIWQTTNSITGNYFIEPDFHYTVINESGTIDNSVITIDADGKMTAVGNGTAIVLVTYDAINVVGAVGGPFFSAILPENTGVFVVSVGADEANITPNMTINETLNLAANTHKIAGINIDAELDVLYYQEDKGGYNYTFKPSGVTSVSLAQPVLGTNTISYAGFSTTGVTANSDGSYTVRLVHGRNIVKLTSATGSVYQVLTAKPVTYTVTNASRTGEKIQPGDKVSVRFNTLYHPSAKLAGVYNMSAYIQYTANGSVVTGKGSQYVFSSAADCQTITATVPAGWNVADDFTFTGGVIKDNGFGDPFGSHRNITLENGRNPNFTAQVRLAYFGVLPDISVKVYDTTTGLDKKSTGDKIDVYPNPFIEYIVIESADAGNAVIYDLSGKVVLSAIINEGKNTIFTKSLNKGIYILRYGSNSMRIVK